MTIRPRRTLARLCFSGSTLLLTFSLVMVGVAITAGAATVSALTPAGQGWYTNRTTNTDPIFNTSLTGGGGSGAFAEDHLLVGWDGPNKKADPIFAVNFDLLQAGVPETAVITSFTITLVEHETFNPEARVHNTPNYDVGVAQGLLVCASPQFVAGTAAEDISRAPERDCSAGLSPTREPAPFEGNIQSAQGVMYRWTADVTSLAKSVPEGEAMSFSFEAKPDPEQGQTWRLAFHNGDYTETDPVTQQPVRKPGVLAEVSYTVPSEAGGGGTIDEGIDDFTGEFEEFDAAPSFGDSEGLVDTLAPTEEPPAPVSRPAPRLIAGAEGEPARFWDIPPLMVLIGLAGFMLLGASGWALQSSPAAPRPPGAASALMNGRHKE